MTTGYLIDGPLWIAAGWTIFHFLWIGAAIGLIALLGRRALASARPEARYAFALLSLAAMTAAPVATFIRLFDPSPTKKSVDPIPLDFRAGSNDDTGAARTLPGESARAERLLQTSGERAIDPTPAVENWRSFANPFVMLLPWLWLAGSPLTFALLASGLIGAERLRRQSQRIEHGEIVRLCQKLVDTLHITRHVAIGVCDRLVAPVLIGVFRPIILLPPAAIDFWTIEHIEMVLWHELAHLRRWDNLINLLQRIVESLLFFHPAVWWVSGWARLERELCCDVLVVAQTGRARAYAEALAALAEHPGRRRLPVAVAMAENQVVFRIRRILNIEAHSMTMKLSRWAVGSAAAVVLAPFLLIGSFARQIDDRLVTEESRHLLAQAPGKTAQRDIPSRRARFTQAATKAATRKHELNVPQWRPGPVPQTVPLKVSGRARDEQGKPVAHAVLFLFSSGMLETKLLGQVTTDANGNYQIAGQLPVVTKHFNLPLQNEITPYAPFVIVGLAPGLGLAWSESSSMYTLAQPNPDDIQQRLPLGRPVELDLWFPKSAALTGRVIDEEAKPVAGCRVTIDYADLLDDQGYQTNNSLPQVWKFLPGSIGLAITNDEGRFLLDRLPDRARFRVNIQRPETEQTQARVFAKTIDEPIVGHAQQPPGAAGIDRAHETKPNDLEITFPRMRRIVVSLIGDDTGLPVAGVDVYSVNEDFQVGILSFGGKTDAAGKVVLWLPPGNRGVIRAQPAIGSRYIRTEEGPLFVEPRQGDQSHEVLLKSGCDLLIEAVEAGTNKPVPEAFFRMIPIETPSDPVPIRAKSSTLQPWTDATGTMRATLTPEPGKHYRLEFAGIRQPNMWDFIESDAANKEGYVADPATSEPIELKAGTTVRLRFVLRKEK